MQGVWVLSEGSAFPTPSADRFRGWLSGFWAASICAEKNSGQKAAVRSAEGERRRGEIRLAAQCGAAILSRPFVTKDAQKFWKSFGDVWNAEQHGQRLSLGEKESAAAESRGKPFLPQNVTRKRFSEMDEAGRAQMRDV